MEFFLGTHQVHWLRQVEAPLFISVRRLRRLKTLPRVLAGWALDSGGFTELSQYGCWQTTPATYAAEVQRC